MTAHVHRAICFFLLVLPACALRPKEQQPLEKKKGSVTNVEQLRYDRFAMDGMLLGVGPSDVRLDEWVQKLEDNLKAHHDSVSEGYSGEEFMKPQQEQYSAWAHRDKLSTVCETGFNAGHSALRFLVESNAHIYEFDLGEHPYSNTSATFLQNEFPQRLTLTWGDSTKTIPQFHKDHPHVQCDLIVVDGGHSLEVATADLTNFMAMASAEHILVIDDTPCKGHHCKGPTMAWKTMIDNGCIEQTNSRRITGTRGFSFGKFTGKC